MPSQTIINPRKKPTQSRSKVTFDAVLQAAAHILAAGGYDALNTNAIAERAGVSIGSLYQYFPNKKAIVTGLIRAKRARLLAGIQQAANANEHSFDKGLECIIAAALNQQLAWPKLAIILHQSEAFLAPESETQALKTEIHQVLADFLHSHAITVDGSTTQDVIAMANGMIEAAGLVGETDVEAVAARVFHAVHAYLTTPPL